jgi:hypothetical protein
MAEVGRADAPARASSLQAVAEAEVKKQAVSKGLEEFITIFFLAAGPALGAAIAVAWLVGLVLGLVAVLTR